MRRASATAFSRRAALSSSAAAVVAVVAVVVAVVAVGDKGALDSDVAEEKRPATSSALGRAATQRTSALVRTNRSIAVLLALGGAARVATRRGGSRPAFKPFRQRRHAPLVIPPSTQETTNSLIANTVIAPLAPGSATERQRRVRATPWRALP